MVKFERKIFVWKENNQLRRVLGIDIMGADWLPSELKVLKRLSVN